MNILLTSLVLILGGAAALWLFVQNPIIAIVCIIAVYLLLK